MVKFYLLMRAMIFLTNEMMLSDTRPCAIWSNRLMIQESKALVCIAM